MSAELLLVDVGNTHVKWATSAARGPIRLAGKTATAKLSAGWITALAGKWPRQHLVLASVVPTWNAGFSRAFRGRVTIVSGGLGRLKRHFDYPKSPELGADRIAAAVAAEAAGWFPAVIVACGTATAFTVLDAKGRLCGGAIAPGLQAQLDALIGATAQLPSTALRTPRSPLGKSTREAIRAGVVLSFQGGIKETIRRLSESMPRGAKPHIILTGGNAKLAAEALPGSCKVRPLLVLEGLRIIGNRVLNRENE
jgi:type III pantothenate kinase